MPSYSFVTVVNQISAGYSLSVIIGLQQINMFSFRHRMLSENLNLLITFFIPLVCLLCLICLKLPIFDFKSQNCIWRTYVFDTSYQPIHLHIVVGKDDSEKPVSAHHRINSPQKMEDL